MLFCFCERLDQGCDRCAIWGGRLKGISSTTSMSTGMPSRVAGLNSHDFTSRNIALSSAGEIPQQQNPIELSIFL